MTINADERLELRELAQNAWGDRGAELLMSGLAGADLDAMEERLTLRVDLARSELRTEIGEFRAEVRGELGEVRGGFAELRTELRTEISDLRGEVKGDIGELKGDIGELKGEIGELRGEIGKLQGYVGMEIGAIRGEIGKQNRLFVFSIIACFASVAAIVFGALQVASA
jgi:hypothetical protein